MRRGFAGLARWALLYAAGCSGASGFSPESIDDSAASDTASTGGDTGDLPDDGLSPVWWKLGATLEVVDSAPVSDEGQLLLELLTEDQTSLCVDTMSVTRIQSHVEPPDPQVYTWWRISHDPPAGDCATADDPVPDGLLLGIGAMHPEILAGLDRMGLSEAADSLNAAYASLDGGETIYVFGVAGTQTTYEGDGTAAADAALTDGEWQIQALYAFSY